MSLEVSFSHAFPGFALEIEFTAPTPGVTVLFGPSGAGKSSVVGAVAGLLRPRTGRVVVDGEVLADSARGLFLPPERRRIGLVFQDARLFPHMTVTRNLRYGQRRAPPGPIRFDDVVALLGIGHLLDRRPRRLSGGERQRVAIGRALLSQPRLLMMDEPLASLDAARKAEILPYLARLHRALSLPILYVTHAAEEVLRLADTLVLLEAGRVVATGPLPEIAARAALPFAARDDAAGVLTARVAGHAPERQLTQLDADGQSVWVPLLDLPEGEAVRVQVPAREVVLATEAPRAVSVHNVLQATVRDVVLDASNHAALVELGIGTEALLARVTPDAVERLSLVPGARVLALFKSMSVVVLPR